MRKLLLVVLGTSLGLLGVEVVLRATVAPERRPATPERIESGRWVDHPFLPFAGRPSASYALRMPGSEAGGRHERVQNNAYGYRSHEFPAYKHADEYFVVCLGGSTTYGRRVESNAQTWPELLEKLLAARYPSRRFKVFNLGLDRATTTVSVVNLALAGVHLQPDLVIVYQGFNDLAALGAADYRSDHAHFYVDFDPDAVWPGFQRSLPPWMLRSSTVAHASYALDTMLGLNDLAQEIGRKRVDGDDPFEGIESMLGNLRTVHDVAVGTGARALFSTFQFRDGDDPSYRRLNESLRTYFVAQGLDYVDQDALIPDRDPTINTDVCHFTQKGRELLAANFFDHIVARGLVEKGVK